MYIHIDARLYRFLSKIYLQGHLFNKESAVCSLSCHLFRHPPFLVFSPWNFVSRAMLISGQWISCTWDKESILETQASKHQGGHHEVEGSECRGKILASTRCCSSKLRPSLAVLAGESPSNQQKARHHQVWTEVNGFGSVPSVRHVVSKLQKTSPCPLSAFICVAPELSRGDHKMLFKVSKTMDTQETLNTHAVKGLRLLFQYRNLTVTLVVSKSVLILHDSPHGQVVMQRRNKEG